MNPIRIKRIYDIASQIDGIRIFVDRLWPRGMKKSEAIFDLWLKEIAPSPGLRKWFNHDMEKWDEFKNKYFEELSHKQILINQILEIAKSSIITLLYSAKNEKCNHALALQEYLNSL